MNVTQPDGAVITRETNVAAYFDETYNRTLLYPTARCLIVGRMALPLELCTIVEGQRYGKKLDELQTAEMIKFTTLNPTARANEIKKGLQLLNYKDSKFLKEFGMKISDEMAVVDARILPAPTICYHRSSKKEATFVPNEGAWNLRDKRVLNGKTLKSWGVLIWATERDISKPQVNNFVQELIQTCSDTGMTISSKDPPVRYVNPQGNIEQYLREQYVVTGNLFGNPELLVCVLPNTGAPLYAEIKRVTDTVLGVASQCLQMRQVKTPKKQYCANVCLKINVKLGGSNSSLREDEVPFITDIPTILIGADVSHPPPGIAR